MNDEDPQRLGEYIRHLREARQISIARLAAQAGIDDSGLSRMERGKVPYPRPDTLSALAAALDAPLADLFALAGYAVPQDLPSVKSYLRIKYSCLPEEHVIAIGNEVEWLAAMYCLKAVDSTTPDA
jgi:transcriptional regulator with XRE-family HTH domain